MNERRAEVLCTNMLAIINDKNRKTHYARTIPCQANPLCPKRLDLPNQALSIQQSQFHQIKTIPSRLKCEKESELLLVLKLINKLQEFLFFTSFVYRRVIYI